MRRPNRSVSIFTLSALDVLAMSTGVFVLLVVLLMPYYRKTHDAGAEIEAVRVAIAQTVAETRDLQQIATRNAAEASSLEAEVAARQAQLAALREAASATPEPAPAPAQTVLEAIDLVFVIDTTASMTPVIRELAGSIGSIVRILERMVPSVRIGVVAYKDRDTGLAPVILLPLTATEPDLPRIAGFVDDLRASVVGSRTLEEDVHLGLDAAMALRFRPDARQALVLIGDAGPHAPYRAEALLRVQNFARTSELRTVSALHVTTPSSLSHGQRGRPFFQEVARAGGGDFNDHTGSMIASVLLSVLTP